MLLPQTVGTSRTFHGKVKEAFTLAFPALLLCLVLDFVGGTVLGANYNDLAKNYPIILVILPGLMDLRGNIFGSMASRLTTALNLGHITSIRDKEVTNNVLLAILGSKIPLIILWTIGLFKVGNLKSALLVLLIVISSAIFIGLILGYSTALITVLPYRKGVDPDMIAAPLITSVSDLITIPALVYFVLLYERHPTEFYLLSVIMFIMLLYLIRIANISRRHRRTFGEVASVLTVLALIESFAGSTLEANSRVISQVLILSVMYPSILDSVGNFSSIIAAKTSTKLHLGGIDAVKSLETIYDIASLLIITPFIAYLTNWLAALVEKYILHQNAGIIWSFIVGYPLIVVMNMFIAVLLAIISYRANLDPDNTTIPAVTTISDAMGTLFVVYLAKSIIGV